MGGVVMVPGRLVARDGGARVLGAEESLLLAVLQQAIEDLESPDPVIRADAGAYIYTFEDDYTIFSFDSICSYFKLSPNAVRQALRGRADGNKRAA
jgi:hypothetical protein